MKIKANNKGFDEDLPSSGHQERFERKLADAFESPKKSFSWIKVAAAAILIVSIAGLWKMNTSTIDNGVIEIADKDRSEIPIDEAEQFYKQSFQSQFDLIAANNSSSEAKSMIEESQILIKELDTQYQVLEKELNETGDQRVAAAMINNYKSRIKILESLVQKLNYVTQLKKGNNENRTS